MRKGNEYDEAVFKGEVSTDFARFAYETFFSDLKFIGVEGMLKLKKPHQVKLDSLARAIAYFEKDDVQDFEKCGYIKVVRDAVIANNAPVLKG